MAQVGSQAYRPVVKPQIIESEADPEGYRRWQASLGRLAQMPESEIAKIDTARLNLFCAAGLPGTNGIDPDVCLHKLEKWTEYVDQNTKRWWPDYIRAPRNGEDSPGKFRMLSMLSLLQTQLGVHYNMPFTEGDYDGRDSRNLLLHGLLTGCGGTCVTMPVLYVAIGRRLGYPLLLVKAKSHYFARWEEPGVERFNVEGSGHGWAWHGDEYYRTWPSPITDMDIRQGCFLRNLTRREELAHFLNERGHCLLDHLRIPEALEAYYHAYQIMPYDGCIRGAWIVASIMHRTLQAAMREADRRGTNIIPIPEVQYPEPRDANEAWAIPHAREMLARIQRIQIKPAAPPAEPKWHRKPRRGEAN